MAAAVLPPPVSVDWEKRKRFTRDEFQQMLESEVFAGQRLELIDGELIDKMGQKPPHASTLRLLQILLADFFGLQRIFAQLPIEVAARDRKNNFPEPDIAVVEENKAEYKLRHPRGDELILAVEIAESSILRDSTTKRDLYARAGIPEYWIVDLEGRRLIVYRSPSKGLYSEVLTLSEAQALEFRGQSLPVAGMLP